MEICGQIVEKCVSNKLRRRLLEKGNFKLEDVMEIARTIETIDFQTKDIRQSDNCSTDTQHEMKKKKQEEGGEKQGRTMFPLWIYQAFIQG